MLLGRLDNGLGFYRFSYNGSDKAYVGVIAQEVRGVMPEAVMRGRDGYLRARLRIRKERQVGVRKQQFSLWPLRSAPGSLGTYGFLTPPYGLPYGLELKNNPRLCTSLRVYGSNTPQEVSCFPRTPDGTGPTTNHQSPPRVFACFR